MANVRYIHIVTNSQVGARILPRILKVPDDCTVELVDSVDQALEAWQNGCLTVMLIDLRVGERALSDFLGLMENEQAPPTVLLGETWHMPSWLKGHLSSKLVFTSFPINPTDINTHVNLLLPQPDELVENKGVCEKEAEKSESGKVEYVIEQIEFLLGENDAR